MHKAIKILLLADAFALLASGMFGPLYAIFVENIGGDLITAGWAYAVFSISTGILLLILGKLEDKMKRSEVLIPVGYGLTSLGILGYLFVSAPWHLFLVQIVLGISIALITPAWDALYSKHLDKGKYGSEWSLEEAETYIVTAIAAASGGVIAKFYGFKTLFLLMFAFAVLGTIISFRLLKK